MTVRFDEADLALFSAASLDFNPLHLSEDYARKSVAGERVVYGCLAFLACLGRMQPPEGQVVASCDLKFGAPNVLGVDYSFTVKESGPGKLIGILRDGLTTPTLTFRLGFRPGTPALADWSADPRVEVTDVARRIGPEDMKPGLGRTGSWMPPADAYRDLLARLSLDRRVWGDAPLFLALCASYLTGMELPGERALFTGLSATLGHATTLPLPFELRLEAYDDRYSIARTAFSLGQAPDAMASGSVTAVVRAELAVEFKTSGVLPEGRVTGKTAVVIGASRGLGAALALELARAGATVIGTYARGDAEAAALTAAADGFSGRILMRKGDSADPAWCLSLRQEIETDFGALDYLICSAAPPPSSLRLEAAAFARMSAYLQKGFALVAAPLSAFLDLLSAHKAVAVLVSSSAVTDPPKIYPHYVAMKSAAEGLFATAAAEAPDVTFWVARPGKMRTDMINTPLGWAGAEAPETVGGRILSQASLPTEPGRIHYC